jgi:hypothetical protein
MRHKPIKVDWDELEVAFNNQDGELVYYLDLVTGHVVLEGEDDLDDENGYYDARAASIAPKDDDTRAYIAPLQMQQKLEWMRAFLDENEATDAEAVGKLREAMGTEDPAAAIIATLREQDEIRDRWYLYRAESLHKLIQSWLDERGVRATTPPPW